MSILVAIILGGLVGYIAARLLGRDEGILASVVIGVIGSFIGDCPHGKQDRFMVSPGG